MRMRECEKCLHAKVCDQSSRQMWNLMCDEKECSDFKDYANYAEVVRCKDCKSFGITDGGKTYCKEPLGMYGAVPVIPDGYCNHGKRKETT